MASNFVASLEDKKHKTEVREQVSKLWYSVGRAPTITNAKFHLLQVYEIEPKPRDHPSSHFRPEQEQDGAGVGIEVVTPSVGEFSRAKVATSTPSDSTNKTETGKEESPAVQVNNAYKPQLLP